MTDEKEHRSKWREPLVTSLLIGLGILLLIAVSVLAVTYS
jgi:hypothetical protein